jgi:PLP dependent protein
MQIEKYKAVINEIQPFGARLVAISKTKPAADIMQLYGQGQRIFGESKVQELLPKYETLPKDIEWHLVGHLQGNKVKAIAPFISMIHSVDSLRLLSEINRQGVKAGRVVNCLLQIFIASEETKFGLSEEELRALLRSNEFKAMNNVRICGLMGMATNTNDESLIEREFKHLHDLFHEVQKQIFWDKPYFAELSMGMSSDYQIALKCGATLIRLGSVIFGER